MLTRFDLAQGSRQTTIKPLSMLIFSMLYLYLYFKQKTFRFPLCVVTTSSQMAKEHSNAYQTLKGKFLSSNLKDKYEYDW